MRRTRLPASTLVDPWRRLLAAILLQAVKDAYFPEQRALLQERMTARVFLADSQALFEELDIPWDRVEPFLTIGSSP